jgi:three-Cys-motif partner protein
MSKDFFQEVKESSKIKSNIVIKYFKAWYKIIQKGKSEKIGYIDLFCGPGKYKDGTESTPLLLLKEVVNISELHNKFASFFTDKENEFVENLRNEIKNIPNIEKLEYKPIVNRIEVSDEVVKILKGTQLIPSFVFIDPCGYKGLSLELVNSVIKDWGCECLFFFNYNRINAGINNELMEDHINKIFGKERANNLRMLLQDKEAYQRERITLDKLVEGLKEAYGKYVQPFCIKFNDKERTSHYLIFVTKNFLGYEIMRGIMGNCSTKFVQGVPSFEYNLRDEPDLFYNPLDDLKNMLLDEYKGKTATMNDIYTNHSVGKNYISKNYKKALIEMFESGKIKAISENGKCPRKGTMGDDIVITFPAKE